MNRNLVLTIIMAILTGMFFVSGLDKLFNLNKVAAGLQSRLPIQVPFVLFVIAILGAAVLEIAAPSVMVYSAYTGRERQLARGGATALALFTVLATLIYHWPPSGKNYYPAISNLTAVGGLLLANLVFSD